MKETNLLNAALTWDRWGAPITLEDFVLAAVRHEGIKIRFDAGLRALPKPPPRGPLSVGRNRKRSHRKHLRGRTPVVHMPTNTFAPITSKKSAKRTDKVTRVGASRVARARKARPAPIQAKILAALAKKTWKSAAQLRAEVGCNLASLAYSRGALERRGLIERRGTNAKTQYRLKAK